MDAFAVSIGLGVKNNKDIRKLALKVALYFGIFQAFMPFLGHFGGIGLSKYLNGFEIYIAFVLLIIIGAKMIYETLSKKEEEEEKTLTSKVLLTLAIATSIDAMAAGYTLHLFNLNVYLSLFIIGLVTFILSYFGVLFGQKGGENMRAKLKF
jgi:manganese efflux pump family protein